MLMMCECCRRDDVERVMLATTVDSREILCQRCRTGCDCPLPHEMAFYETFGFVPTRAKRRNG